MTDVERTLGAHEARIGALESSRLQFERDIRDSLRDMHGENGMILDRIAVIHDAVTSAKGSWRAIGWISGISSTVAAVFLWFYHTLAR